MDTMWLLRTKGNPLRAIQSFLDAIWQQAELDGMLVPYYQGETGDLMPHLLTDRTQLANADLFVPVMLINSARLIVQTKKQRPYDRLAAVLRPCESRALEAIYERDPSLAEGWLTIGMDCLPSFPAEDLEWRIRRAGGIAKLTRESLRFAYQGGIAPYRYRAACRMCSSPAATEAEFHISLIGLPVKTSILITARRGSLAQQFHLDEITAGLAPLPLIAQHERILNGLSARRKHYQEQVIELLAGQYPISANDLIALLDNCAPCHCCLESCPLFTDELAAYVNSDTVLEGPSEVTHWLSHCVSCGMCEQACPEHRPLTALHYRIREDMAAGLPL